MDTVTNHTLNVTNNVRTKIKNDKPLFNLIHRNNEWKYVMNQEISVRYSKEQIKILEEKIDSLKNNKTKTLEFPKLKESEIERIRKK